MTVETPGYVPSLTQVGAYVPQRTVQVGIGTDTLSYTFDGSTTPTAAAVTSLRTDAVQWMTSRLGMVAGPVMVQASYVAAIRTAGMIELSLASSAEDMQQAQFLLAQADEGLTALVTSNEDAGGGINAGGLLPQWSFEPYDARRRAFYEGRDFL